MSPALQTLESFQALTEAMAKAAEDQEWDELARIGEERAALSPPLPSDLATKMTSAEFTQGRMILERCQQLDARIYSLVEGRQQELRVLLREPRPVT